MFHGTVLFCPLISFKWYGAGDTWFIIPIEVGDNATTLP